MKKKTVSGMMLTLLRVFLLFALGTTLLNVVPVSVAQPTEPTIYVEPSMSFAEPGERFNVTVEIQHAVDVFAWGVNMSFDPNVVDFQEAFEGDFLAGQPEGTTGLLMNEFVGFVYMVESTVGDYMGVTGRGALAIVEFEAIEGVTGETVLNISDPGIWNDELGYHIGGTNILDHLEREIPRSTLDGYFANTDYPPVASFTYSPSFPEVDETIHFDASVSRDPDGSIIRYEWDFGDGDCVNETDPITTHTYTDWGIYIVTLTVIDDAAKPHVWYETYSTMTEELETRSPHNVAVLSVAASPPTVKVGESVSVDVIVLNKGTWDETFGVNIYYDGHSAAPAQTVTDLAPDTNMTLSFTWDTTDVPPDTYRINATAGPVEGELNLADNTKLSGTITVEEWSLYDLFLALNSSYYSLLADYNDLLDDYSSLLADYDDLLDSYDTLSTNFNILTALHNFLAANYTNLQNSYDSLSSNHSSLQADYDSLESSYNDLQSQLDALTSDLDTATNLNYLFIVTTIVFIASTVYLAIRKSKVQQPKTT